ncbi:MAG TPA: hypothetical protein VHZ32_16865 [Rhizomicrobium sp.]|nr:hypothetical protein [Rhizomicrobium sp.]
MPDEPHHPPERRDLTETGHAGQAADRKGARGMRINQLFSEAIRDIDTLKRTPGDDQTD